MLVNGNSGTSISIRDRGLLYGDGVFRTLLARKGQVRFWHRHLNKLQRDCQALAISCPAPELLTAELHRLLQQQPEALLKLIVTRGQGSRGYAPHRDSEPSHIWDVFPAPEFALAHLADGVQVRICDLRLAAQPKLAGIKHLNRLENVLAAAEWQDSAIAEGVLLDAQDRIIEGTRSNIFALIGGVLVSPDLSRCGVAGVQREWVIDWAQCNAYPVQVRDMSLSELIAADEVFLTNSVFGIWPVRQLAQRLWTDFSLAHRLNAALALVEE